MCNFEIGEWLAWLKFVISNGKTQLWFYLGVAWKFLEMAMPRSHPMPVKLASVGMELVFRNHLRWCSSELHFNTIAPDRQLSLEIHGVAKEPPSAVRENTGLRSWLARRTQLLYSMLEFSVSAGVTQRACQQATQREQASFIPREIRGLCQSCDPKTDALFSISCLFQDVATFQ